MAIKKEEQSTPTVSFLKGDLSRAEFLKGGGALVVGFSLAGSLVASLGSTAFAASRRGAAAAPAAPPLPGDITHTPQVDAWLVVRPNNTVEVYQGKVEIGGGEFTSIAQIAADELYLPFSGVTMHRVETSTNPFDPGTYGSQSITGGGASVRVAAATAREALLTMAATKLGTTADKLTIQDGVISAGAKKVTYAQLIAGKHFDLKVTTMPTFRKPQTYQVVGQAVPRVDLPQKLTGSDGPYQYLVNLRVPGMVHARILRPPAFGAKLESIDMAKAKAMPGVIDVVPLTFGPKMTGWNKVWPMQEGDFVAVIAKDENQAIDALNALGATAKWGQAATLPTLHTTEQMADYLRTFKPVLSKVQPQKQGNPTAAIAAAPKKISAHYATPYLTNGPIGPGCAVVDVANGKATVWSGSQVPFSVQSAVAAVTGLAANKVNVVQYDSAGSYGRGNIDDVALEAAVLSQKVGRPVRVQWMRQEEFIWSTQKTPEAINLQGGVNSQGQLLGWTSEVWSDTHVAGGLFGATYGGGVLPTYNTAHETQVHYVQTALRKGAMRGLGAWPTVFAHEGFIDELAFLSGTDPVAFRLKNLTDPRGIAVIKEAAKMAGWTSHTKARAQGIGQGISFLHDVFAGTYVAEIATVKVDKASGQVTVQNVAVAHDCGLVINPNGVKNQIEGGIIQGTSWTIHEQLKFNNQTVTSVEWLGYPILRFEEVPNVDVHLINRPELPAGGVGEPASMAIGGAIGNAFFDATGVRVRATPFTAARVKMFLA